MTDVEEWCVDSEYGWIESDGERNVKFLHDYLVDHGRGDFDKVASEVLKRCNSIYGNDRPRHLEFIDIGGKGMFEVRDGMGILAGILNVSDLGNGELIRVMKSYVGVGGIDVPVIESILVHGVYDVESFVESSKKAYGDFDKSIIDGAYLEDESSLRKMYTSMVLRSKRVLGTR